MHKKSKALYLDKPPVRRKRRRSFAIPSIIMSFLVILSGLGIGATSALSPTTVSAQDGPIEWIVCNWAGGEGSPAYFAYQVAFTDDLAYMFNSKSAIVPGTDDVSTGANLLLGLSNDFVGTNEKILGYSLDPTKAATSTTFNGGTKVNPYDRFGFAGLYWSSYGGEWNYLKVNICSPQTSGVNMRIGAFYDGRLAPLSTWSGVANSNDVRSLLAADKGMVSSNNWINIVANGVFNLTKLIVATTTAFIGVAFSDIVGASGLGNLVAGNNGVFSKLYNGIYLPLIVLIMLIMAVWAFWKGIVKRSYRATLGGILQSVALFFTAAIVAFNPLFFISLPNNIAIVAQSLIINALGSNVYGSGDSLCAVGGKYTTDADGKLVLDTTSDGSSDPKTSQNLLEQAASATQSVIGCQLWYTYAFKPWVLGQYGTDYNSLWANGFTSQSSDKASAKELGNDNSSWVGNAAVPLGGGYIENNWALFQLSTQTNVHSALGTTAQGKISTYTDGVANDWWRVVDAVSNYNEVVQTNTIPSTSQCQTGSNIADSACNADTNQLNAVPVQSNVPDVTKEPTPYWSDWNGSQPTNRLVIAISSLVPAIFGNLTPLLFAGLSAIYAISLAVAMAFAPIFLLLGSWPGVGWNAFKEWGQLVLNMMMKRILLGTLLMLSIVIISMILRQTSEVNYFVGIMAILIVSVAIFKMRTTIFEKVSGIFSFNFASGAFKDTTTPAIQRFTKGAAWAGKSAGRLASSAAIGGVVGNYAKTEAGEGSDTGFWNGAGRGFRQQMRTIAYQNSTLNSAALIADQLQPTSFSDQEISHEEVCSICGLKLWNFGDTEFFGGQLPDGNWVCAACMNGENPETGDPMEMGAKWVSDIKFVDKFDDARRPVSEDDITRAGYLKKEKSSQEKPILLRKDSSMDSTLDSIEIDSKAKKSTQLIQAFQEAFKKEVEDYRETQNIPAFPKALQKYVPEETQFQMNELWRDGSKRAIETATIVYAQAMVNYSYDVQKLPVGELSDDLSASAKDEVRFMYGKLISEMVDEANKPK